MVDITSEEMTRLHKIWFASREMGLLEQILYIFNIDRDGRINEMPVFAEMLASLKKEYQSQSGYEVVSLDEFKTKLLPGHFTVVSGVAASGKTTFCKMLSNSYMMCQGKIGLYELSHSGLFAQTDIMTYDEMGRSAISTDIASKNLKKNMKGCIGHWLIVSITPPMLGYDTVICIDRPGEVRNIYFAQAKIGQNKYLVLVPHYRHYLGVD